MGSMQTHALSVDHPATVHPPPPRPRSAAPSPLAAASAAALLRALRAYHGYTAAHSEAVVELALGAARALRVPLDQLQTVAHTALLHDVGKVGLPTELLEKPGPLSELELAQVRRHTEVGARLVGSMPGLRHLAHLVRATHERWDGLGYPDGLRGEQIPLASRIVFACDAFDAMTSERSYSPALPPARALEEMAAYAGTQFCPASVGALISTVTGTVRGGRPRSQSPDPVGGRRSSRC
jgi:HD-GYP domain-containing protein (c-di-GMP phosphodiesterase class II)